MDYHEMVRKIRKRFENTDVREIPGVLAFQFNVIGKYAGIFYIEIKDGSINVEPYEYYDRNAVFTVEGSNLIKLMDGKLDPIVAFTTGKIQVEGDTAKALELIKILKK